MTTEKPALHCVSVPNAAFQQVGIDLISLPETAEDFKYVVVLADYFTKYPEAMVLKDKTAVSIARFIFSCMCKHGCFAIQINDQGTEFVNKVSAEMHRLMGTKHRVTSAYHPQANGLIERFNQTLKGKLRKLLDTRSECWPEILEAALFAHRCDKHQSTGYSPFFMLYGRIHFDGEICYKNMSSAHFRNNAT